MRCGITVAATLLVNNPGDWSHVYAAAAARAMARDHADDLIFPLFLFIVGVSIALAVSSRIEHRPWWASCVGWMQARSI